MLSSSTVGSAVQKTSRRVLPGSGGPSLSSSPGFMRNCHTEYSTTVTTSTKIGIDAITRTWYRRSVFRAWVLASTGNQWITKLRTMPIAVAITAATAATTIVRCLDMGDSGERGNDVSSGPL